MPIWLDILLWVLLGLSAGVLGYWGAVLYHVVRTMRTVPTLRDALELPAPERWPPLCVVIPAHNEEGGIGELIQSLKEQDYPALRVVLALDRCTDRTAEIVRAATSGDDRFEVIEIDSCPDDWVGKVHAIWSGYTAAQGVKDAELILFLDADTHLKPECIRASVTLLSHRGVDMLSLVSTLTADKWFEKVVQPAAGMELMRQYPIVRANSEEKRRAFANGQFILVKREAYEAIGGHTAVKSEVLEDVWLARHLVAKGRRTSLFFADGLLYCKMYDTWKAFEKGWMRIFGECSNRKPKRMREAAWRLRLTSTILPTGAVVGLAASIVALTMYPLIAVSVLLAIASTAAVVLFLGIIGFAYRFGRTPVLFAPMYIVGSWIAAGIMLKAARDLARGNPTHWGGKAYQREKR